VGERIYLGLVDTTKRKGDISKNNTQKKGKRRKGRIRKEILRAINRKERKERNFPRPHFFEKKIFFSSRLRRLVLRRVFDPCSTRNLLSDLLQTLTYKAPSNGVSIFSQDEQKERDTLHHFHHNNSSSTKNYPRENDANGNSIGMSSQRMRLIVPQTWQYNRENSVNPPIHTFHSPNMANSSSYSRCWQ
jgi:hypothetical protein